MATKIEVRIVPHAEYKGKVITKIGNWYKVKGDVAKYRSLPAATGSIK